MTTWSLSQLLSSLHKDIQQNLDTVKQSIHHPGTKGDASESVWLEFLQNYLPRRYQAETAFVVDSKDQFSQQIDIVIFDRQYSPFIFKYKKQLFIPAESIYAIFEVKPTLNAHNIKYAQEKVASVRKLHRTSLPIPHAGGLYPAKPLIPIIGGVLTLDSEWKNPALGKPLLNALSRSSAIERLDIGCIAAHGYFNFDPKAEDYKIFQGDKPATAFLFCFISNLQFSATVPMIDIQAYAKWL